jgi:hypothetical protein
MVSDHVIQQTYGGVVTAMPEDLLEAVNGLV